MEKKIAAILQDGIYTREDIEKLPSDVVEDLYLKHLIKEGNLDEVDKLWVKYYKDYPTKILDKNDSLYENYVKANLDNNDGLAIFDGNYGRKIMHEELKQLIDAFANGLVECGVEKGSKIAVLVNGTYEEPLCLLAPNKLGALVRYLDFTKNPQELQSDIERLDADIILMDEMFLPMEGFINPKGKTVIVINSHGELNKPNYVSFDSVLNLGASRNNVSVLHGFNGDPSVIINSSGTTGLSKPIVHSNKTVSSVTQKLFYTNYPLERGNFIFKSIPSHIGLGLITTMYSSLISGTGVILSQGASPQQSIEEAMKYLGGFKQFLKANDFDEDAQLLEFFAPMFVRIIEQNIDKIEDLSHIGAMLAAGSKMSKEELVRQSFLFHEKGMNVPICNGYGQNEFAGAIALNDNVSNVNGSAGYPVIGTDLKVLDPITGVELPNYKEGRIVERSSSKFLEYQGMPEETENSKITINDEEWYDTKDLGYKTNTGHVFITGRMSRIMVRYDVKISLDKIEKKILNHPNVKGCAVVAIEHNGEEAPYAYVVTDAKKGLTEILEEIQSSNEKINDLEYPVEFESVSELPVMNNGKVDYQGLRKQAISKMSGQALKRVNE